MERIGDTLNRLGNKSSFRERYKQMRQEILEHPDVIAFLNDHRGEVTMTMVERSMGNLYEFITQRDACKNCTSLETCKSIIPGYHPKLVIENNAIGIRYVPTEWKIIEDERKKAEQLVQCIHVPREVLQATLADVTLETSKRLVAVKYAKKFVLEYTGENFMKGIYLHGPFGTGKTFLLGAIASGLAEKQISSMIVYVPEFIREMKQAIGDNTLGQKVDVIKKAQVLMFDDIGAETVSSWVRDEVLGPILQYRMLEKLPTFFTSNFNLEDLEHHLTYSQRGEAEKVKAGRIIERIQFLATPLEYDGPNKRFKN